MQLIFDHLTAVIVSAIVLGVVLTLNVRSQEDAMEATRFHAAKAQQTALIDILEYDLEDLGSGVPTGEQMITEYEADGFGIETFEFMRELADASGATRVVRVRYTRSYVGSYTTTKGGVIPYFRVQRYVETEDGTMVSTTGDGYEVAALNMILQGEDGEAATENLNAATSIEVHLKSALPFQSGEDQMRFTSWQGTFRPSNLARRSDAVGGVGTGT